MARLKKLTIKATTKPKNPDPKIASIFWVFIPKIIPLREPATTSPPTTPKTA